LQKNLGAADSPQNRSFEFLTFTNKRQEKKRRREGERKREREIGHNKRQ
jgi:hypothetical protein